MGWIQSSVNRFLFTCWHQVQHFWSKELIYSLNKGVPDNKYNIKDKYVPSSGCTDIYDSDTFIKSSGYSRLRPNLSKVVKELRQVSLEQPLKLQAQRHNTLQAGKTAMKEHKHTNRICWSWDLAGSLPRERRRWSAAWRSSGCTFPWIHCTAWMARCTRNTEEPLWDTHINSLPCLIHATLMWELNVCCQYTNHTLKTREKGLPLFKWEASVRSVVPCEHVRRHKCRQTTNLYRWANPAADRLTVGRINNSTLLISHLPCETDPHVSYQDL